MINIQADTFNVNAVMSTAWGRADQPRSRRHLEPAPGGYGSMSRATRCSLATGSWRWAPQLPAPASHWDQNEWTEAWEQARLSWRLRSSDGRVDPGATRMGCRPDCRLGQGPPSDENCARLAKLRSASAAASERITFTRPQVCPGRENYVPEKPKRMRARTYPHITKRIIAYPPEGTPGVNRRHRPVTRFWLRSQFRPRTAPLGREARRHPRSDSFPPGRSSCQGRCCPR